MLTSLRLLTLFHVIPNDADVLSVTGNPFNAGTIGVPTVADILFEAGVTARITLVKFLFSTLLLSEFPAVLVIVSVPVFSAVAFVPAAADIPAVASVSSMASPRF